MKTAKKFIVATIIVGSLCATSLAFAGSCSVTINFPDGSARKGIKVSGLTAGLAGTMLSNVYTDSNGQVTLNWGNSGSLETVFVDGEDQHTRCTNGSSVSFVIKP
ncbi:MAG: hypothetical protein K9L60_13400 [Methylovulum sp.]|nr:hypothetical protein [Methylovulum sp.]